MPITHDIELTATVSAEIKAQNAAINQKRDVRRFSTQPERDGDACIVGGGPSLADCLDELRMRKAAGQYIFATNNTFQYLLARGIKPDAHVILDARESCIKFLRPTKGVTYYLNVSCHPSLFEKLAGHDIVMYDLNGAGTGSTVGLKALYLAGFSGFRKFHLIGMDSSYRDSDHHAYRQTENDAEEIHEVDADGVKFMAAVWMIVQAEEFQQIAKSLAEQDCILTVSGDGLLPHVARRISRIVRCVTAIYDLRVCPPTYDFASYLGEAERHRIAIGAEMIDIVVLPGDLEGFRADGLPDSLESRHGMLHRVVAGLSRLLPSVRNVQILRHRQHVDGQDVFPPQYRGNPLVQAYGAPMFRNSSPILKATKLAKAAVARRCLRPYVTITLRESSHWPQRNSNMDSWRAAAKHIESRGYEVVWVPDAESSAANMFSWDVDLRLALYEGAIVNLGVNNGPMCMNFYTSARYIIFNHVTDGIPWCEPKYLTECGQIEGDQHGGRGRIIWRPDDAETIIEEVDRFLAKGARAAA